MSCFISHHQPTPLRQGVNFYGGNYHNDGVFWWIQSVYVHPDFRKRSVFKSLYQHVETSSRTNPTVCGLRLYVEKENTHAQAVYHRLGMKDAGYTVYEVEWKR